MKHIPFLDLKQSHQTIEKELSDAYQRVMRSGHYILGPEVDAFEQQYAEFNQVDYCVGVGNGLDALTLLLIAYGIGEGDEVIVPANTYIATWLAVSRCGATIIPVEPDENTFNIDPLLIEEHISAKTAAIMPVHLYGQTADMLSICDIAAKHGLIVISDGAQSQGATINGKPVSTFGDATATSFYPGKNLGAIGDGGAILTNDKTIYEKVKSLRNYGSSKKYYNQDIGINSRLDELQAALLSVKLKYLASWNANRVAVAALYSQSLSDVDNIVLPTDQTNGSVWHQYVIRCDQRDSLQAYLQARDIGTMIHYPVPPHKQACYSEYEWPELALTEQISTEILSLPIYPDLTDESVLTVASAIKDYSVKV